MLPFLGDIYNGTEGRSSVVGIFPSTDTYIRLITSYLLEYTEDWQTESERAYMNSEKIQSQKEVLFAAA